jgi:threonine/homoserine/homoserine lactone efflux protein
MRLEQAVACMLFSIVAAGTPGPSNGLLVATGARVGVRRGLPALLGVAAGMGLLMFVVGFGLGRVILDNPTVLAGAARRRLSAVAGVEDRDGQPRPAGGDRRPANP